MNSFIKSDNKIQRQSERSSRAGSTFLANTYNPVTGSVMKSISQGIVKFEDPAQALNLSDDKWNEIVQKGARDYVEENKRKQQQKLE